MSGHGNHRMRDIPCILHYGLGRSATHQSPLYAHTLGCELPGDALQVRDCLFLGPRVQVYRAGVRIRRIRGVEIAHLGDAKQDYVQR